MVFIQHYLFFSLSPVIDELARHNSRGTVLIHACFDNYTILPKLTLSFETLSPNISEIEDRSNSARSMSVISRRAFASDDARYFSKGLRDQNEKHTGWTGGEPRVLVFERRKREQGELARPPPSSLPSSSLAHKP